MGRRGRPKKEKTNNNESINLEFPYKFEYNIYLKNKTRTILVEVKKWEIIEKKGKFVKLLAYCNDGEVYNAEAKLIRNKKLVDIKIDTSSGRFY